MKRKSWARRRAFVTITLSATAFIHPAEAANIGQDIGPGQDLCAQYSKAYAANSTAEQNYWNWAMGMMSGLNFASVANSNVFRDLRGDEDIYRRAIRLYCSNHPLTTYSGAVLDLYVSMPLKKTGSN